jgi:hypothetical protein
MGIFNRRKTGGEDKSLFDHMTDKVMDIKKLIGDDDQGVSVVCLVGSDKDGTSLVQGKFGVIRKMLEMTCNQDENFQEVLMDVAAKIAKTNLRNKIDKGDESMPDALKKIFNQLDGNKSGVVELPDGTKALAIDKKGGVESMTDAEVDDIINKMLEEASNRRKNGEEGKSEE